MPAQRLSMRKIKDLLRLKHACQLSNRQVARCLSLSHSTVGDYLRRAEAAGLCWPLPDDLSELELERRLFPDTEALSTEALPDWNTIHREYKKKGVTLQLLWQEYRLNHETGYSYSRFCERYRLWQGKLDLVMRQDHRAGEKLFVDYAGQTVPVTDPKTGELRQAQVFVAVLGASNYTYCEATFAQSLPDWIGAHERAFAFFGGVPEIVVPDNLKSGVIKAHRYEPDLNPTYQDLALHYGVAIIPARVKRPRDKAKVENGVGLVERWILACLRNECFFSLDEVNRAIGALLERLNTRPFKKLPGSRRALFESLERPVLRPLPATAFCYAEWKKVRVGLDYHVELEAHYYSVPYQLVRQQLDLRYTATTVECFFRGKRVASHLRSHIRGGHTTVAAHMPKAHRAYAEWTPRRLLEWAGATGAATRAFIEALLERRVHPQQGFRSSLGLIGLAKTYGALRLEAACRRALRLESYAYKSVASILKHDLDQAPLPETQADPTPLVHANIRGSAYYARQVPVPLETPPHGHGSGSAEDGPTPRGASTSSLAATACPALPATTGVATPLPSPPTRSPKPREGLC